jgi:hypothetical protein
VLPSPPTVADAHPFYAYTGSKVVDVPVRPGRGVQVMTYAGANTTGTRLRRAAGVSHLGLSRLGPSSRRETVSLVSASLQCWKDGGSHDEDWHPSRNCNVGSRLTLGSNCSVGLAESDRRGSLGNDKDSIRHLDFGVSGNFQPARAKEADLGTAFYVNPV